MNADGLVQAIVFDFDGVIVDSMPSQSRLWLEAVDRVLGAEAAKYHSQIQANFYAGAAGPRMFESITLSDEQRRRLRTTKDELWQRIRRDVPLFPLVAATIPRLAQHYPLGIATTADREYVNGVLRREGLERWIRCIVTDFDGPPKPAPDMLYVLARKMNVPVERLCLVGDTVTDLQMSRSAGSQFLLFRGHSPDSSSSNERESVEVATSWAAIDRRFGAPPSSSS